MAYTYKLTRGTNTIRTGTINSNSLYNAFTAAASTVTRDEAEGGIWLNVEGAGRSMKSIILNAINPA